MHTLRPLFLLLVLCAFGMHDGKTEKLKPGDIFRDCEVCPEMAVIPAGRFEMGARDYDSRAVKKRELPRVSIQIDAFAIGRFEVTREQYQACVDDGGCEYSPGAMFWEKLPRTHGEYPIVHIAWEDAQQYVAWLSEHTGFKYSLPSEAEWEYAARGGTSTIYWWGDDLGVNNAHCVECGGGHPFLGDHKSPLPVGSLSPNPFGLYDVIGNVREHVQDCFGPLKKLPPDGTAYEKSDCTIHSLRGSAFDEVASSRAARLSSRSGAQLVARERSYGFRVKRRLDQ
ncbi:formylglycine-generating enzyme family protein [Kordiimonas lacus]|uniref:Formylglycine-generating enzyme, required for sulfatase activity, contains SUMF1/FGE domain n=1 Tax=Kordiimonas lacus TaxID=637679 RepID=A0A1G7B4K7_9PROT|nr:SUMF1/EgtB/PvdO family nonheme iron enzyme [Kordiimonas lacus]SDE22029.1 Formylglycine-generating enzyme, required for sulfatase activity, contains SUMF1/FGE domain [Kordiimonas lacus]